MVNSSDRYTIADDGQVDFAATARRVDGLAPMAVPVRRAGIAIYSILGYLPPRIRVTRSDDRHVYRDVSFQIRYPP